MKVGVKNTEASGFAPIHGKGALDAGRYGARGVALRKLAEAGLRTPAGLILSTDYIAAFDPDAVSSRFNDAIAALLEKSGALAVRPSPVRRRSGEGAAIRDLATVEDVTEAIVQARDAYGSFTGRTLRAAMGLAADAGLAVVLQPVAADPDRIWFRRPADGWPEIRLQRGRFSTEEVPADLGPRLEALFGDAVEAQAVVGSEGLTLLDAFPAVFSPRAGLKVAVDLAERGAIPHEEALLRTDPAALTDELHPRLEAAADVKPFARGLAASPGAAVGPLVFTAVAAERAAAQGTPAILARVETGPEDIRGMHAAAGVLTLKGGLSSHAAVVARGLGRPCVVGPGGLSINRDAGALILESGSRMEEGALLTIDGTGGAVFAGRVPLAPPEPSAAFELLMRWSDEARRLRVRANADTAEEARTARRLGAEGIGLCRTEHMLFAPEREAVMRSLILSEDAGDRESALSKLLEWQRADFTELFTIMHGLPVTIRLLDPPLHEFLPRRAEAISELADQLGRNAADVTRRVEELREFNPMLGMRGCRVGVTQPDIYAMQARAILEAAADAADETGEPVTPEIMIPLVSTNREVEILKAVIDGAADLVRGRRGDVTPYRIGAMVETPRAALRAGALALTAEFLSFGTNDLTQMTYGLSRDDAGRFMRDYVRQEVFPDDPFQTLDVEGVGELLGVAVERARSARSNMTLGICGEHGGDADSISFFESAGFDYISCSPYRVPSARLAAAQTSISGSTRHAYGAANSAQNSPNS